MAVLLNKEVVSTTIGKKGEIIIDRKDEIERLTSKIGMLEFVYKIDRPSLSNTERLFLAHCILLDQKGIRIGSLKALKYMMKTLNIKKTRVYDLRRYLRNKGWLILDDNGYSYPNILVKDNLTIQIK